MTTDATRHLPALDAWPAPLKTLRDALEDEVVCAAIEDVVARHRQDVRAWIAEQPDVSAALTSGDGWAQEVPGAGGAIVTSPGTKAHVTDEAAFTAWAIRTDPDSVTTRETVRWDVVEDAMASDPDLRDTLLSLLDGIPGAVVTETLLPAKYTADLIKPKRSEVLPDGRVVDRDTGEVIPGLEARPASTPSLRVRPDKDAIAALADRLYGSSLSLTASVDA